MSTQSKIDRDHKILQALKKIRSYNKAGRFSEVLAISKDTISENTLRTWVADNKKALKAYKADHIIDIASKLEPIGNKKWMAYELALQELCVDIDEQDRIENFRGLYEVIHDLPSDYTKDLDKLSFGAKDNYKFFWTRFIAESSQRFCDGFVFVRKNKIILAGTSKYMSLFASLNIIECDMIIMRGAALIDDHRSQRTFGTKICLIKTDEKDLGMDIQPHKAYVSGSFYEV